MKKLRGVYTLNYFWGIHRSVLSAILMTAALAKLEAFTQFQGFLVSTTIVPANLVTGTSVAVIGLEVLGSLLLISE